MKSHNGINIYTKFPLLLRLHKINKNFKLCTDERKTKTNKLTSNHI